MALFESCGSQDVEGQQQQENNSNFTKRHGGGGGNNAVVLLVSFKSPGGIAKMQ